MIMSIERAPLSPAATAVLDRLPAPNYKVNYQPTYPEQDRVGDAVHELLETRPVTTFERVDGLQDELTALACGAVDTPLVVTERCAEPVDANVPIDTMASRALSGQAVVGMAMNGKAIHIMRIGGQSVKPRSAEFEELADGRKVPPYMGDGVNGMGVDERTPDPSRMVAMALQGRDLVDRVAALTGRHPYIAHEGLLLPYEYGLMRVNPATGKTYGLSADLLWGGVRTNGATGAHIDMLASLANPVAVKIGPNTTAADIQGLNTKLNPARIPGRLTFMLRTGPGNEGTLGEQVQAIRKHAREALNCYDVHGVTRSRDGHKIRAVPEIIDDITTTATVLGDAGLKLHGVHLETIPDHNRLECVDASDQLPTHPGGVDPQLNPRQTYTVLRAVAPHLLQPV